MSLDIKSTILSNRYSATVQPGSRRYQVATYSAYQVPYDSTEYITTKSVQIDMHPADFSRLVDTLDYLHGDNRDKHGTAMDDRFGTPITVHEKFIQHVYQKEFKEQELREKHPLLQDLWQQYQMTLNLVTSGQFKDNE